MNNQNPQEVSSKKRIFKSESRQINQLTESRDSQIENEQIKVSAIISTYKSEKFIRGCLQDLIEQSLYEKGQLEIIIIDSNSPENEQAIVREFQQQYNNIIYEKTSARETLYTAWNRAIKKARGDYITNANTDDRHRFDSFEILASYLDNHPDISVVYGDQLITTVPNETLINTQASRHWNWPDYSYEKMRQACCVGSQPMWRKLLHEKYGYFREEFECAGDYEFWLRIGSQGEKMKLVPDILGLYYLNPQGLEHGTSGQGLKEHYQICQEYDIPCSNNPLVVDIPYKMPNVELIGNILTKPKKSSTSVAKKLLNTLRKLSFSQNIF